MWHKEPMHAVLQLPETPLVTGTTNSATADEIITRFAKDSNPLIVTVYYIYQSVLVAQNNLSLVAEQLQANAAAQTFLNNEEALYQYTTIPKTK